MEKNERKRKDEESRILIRRGDLKEGLKREMFLQNVHECKGNGRNGFKAACKKGNIVFGRGS